MIRWTDVTVPKAFYKKLGDSSSRNALSAPPKHYRQLTEAGIQSAKKNESNVTPPISGSFQNRGFDDPRLNSPPLIHPPPIHRKMICIYVERVYTDNSLHTLSFRQQIRGGSELHKGSFGTAAPTRLGRSPIVDKCQGRHATDGRDRIVMNQPVNLKEINGR